MRSGYGKNLREHLCKYNPLKLIDLGKNIFKYATVDTNILFVRKNNNDNGLLGLNLLGLETEFSHKKISYSGIYQS